MTAAPFDPAKYGPVIAELFKKEGLSPLDAGCPKDGVRASLESLQLREAFAPRAIVDQSMADACKSGLWLYHDFLDESHQISQEIHTTTGSFWHGIMHRREPDFPNAKYWFRKVGVHPIFAGLRDEAARLAEESPHPDVDWMVKQEQWDPFRFVDLCEQASRGKQEVATLCRRIQQREWELLFDYCFDHAVD